MHDRACKRARLRCRLASADRTRALESMHAARASFDPDFASLRPQRRRCCWHRLLERLQLRRDRGAVRGELQLQRDRDQLLGDGDDVLVANRVDRDLDDVRDLLYVRDVDGRADVFDDDLTAPAKQRLSSTARSRGWGRASVPPLGWSFPFALGSRRLGRDRSFRG
jgi:hypothetical protein